jgi:clan AA aspartic protease
VRGHVSENRDATLSLEVSGPDGDNITVDAAIDTGFTGYIVLSSGIIRELSLPRFGFHEAILGDGETVLFDAYLLTIVWFDSPRLVIALESDVDPLVGISLLWNSRVTMDVVDGGAVTNEPMPDS